MPGQAALIARDGLGTVLVPRVCRYRLWTATSRGGKAKSSRVRPSDILPAPSHWKHGCQAQGTARVPPEAISCSS